MIPKINAASPERMLMGKQTKPVKGNGTIPVQNVKMVKVPKTRLKMDCLFVEREDSDMVFKRP